MTFQVNLLTILITPLDKWDEEKQVWELFFELLIKANSACCLTSPGSDQVDFGFFPCPTNNMKCNSIQFYPPGTSPLSWAFIRFVLPGINAPE